MQGFGLRTCRNFAYNRQKTPCRAAWSWGKTGECARLFRTLVEFIGRTPENFRLFLNFYFLLKQMVTKNHQNIQRDWQIVRLRPDCFAAYRHLSARVSISSRLVAPADDETPMLTVRRSGGVKPSSAIAST